MLRKPRTNVVNMAMLEKVNSFINKKCVNLTNGAAIFLKNVMIEGKESFICRMIKPNSAKASINSKAKIMIM